VAANLIVVDTHVLLWWAFDPDKLSAEALRLVGEMERHGGFASAISIWELGVKVKRRKLELPISIEEFASRIERGGVLQLLPVDTSTWLRSLSLAWEHPDPADRVIVATALMQGVPLLTKDTTIHTFQEVTCVW
jgi:PIN domain nuclease of toxin-antitoxin system